MKKFLSAVLPDRGTYFAAHKNRAGGFIHTPCKDIDDLILEVTELDEEQCDVYFACASFKQENVVDEGGKITHRTADNAGWAKSFWLDIDCGEDKAAKGAGYRTTDDAEVALVKFTEAVGLPMPMLVSSGGGLHCYWPLEETISKEGWKPTADKLKSLTKCAEIELLADPTRTADIASILRPIGTHNWKPERGGKEVVLKSDALATSFEQFSQNIDRAYAKYCTEKKLSPKDSRLVTYITRDPETEANIERVKSALASINPDCGYELWRDVCFAVHALGWNCSEQLARSWSQGELTDSCAASFDDQAFDKLWESIKPDGAITPGTLFHHAKSNGWADPRSFQDAKDIRNGRLFAEANRGKLLFIGETGDVLRFTQDGWVRGQIGEAEIAAKEVVVKMRVEAVELFRQSHESVQGKELEKHAMYSSTSQKLQAMIELAQSEQGMSVSVSMFDAAPHLLGVQNGILNLKSRQLQQITPDCLVSKRCNVEFDQAAECPLWTSFLNDVQPEKSTQELLQQLAGVFLCGDANLQKLIFLYGQGANGKSTFIELMSWLLGDYSKRIATEMLMQHQRSPQGPSADIVGLKGRRLVYCNEVEEGRHLAEARVKELTGGDTLTGRVPYAREDITFQPSHKLVMVGNHQPEIRDMSHGMWRRMLFIPFEQTIAEGKRDPALLDKLKAEGSGILNWALAGYHDYLRCGLRVPASVDGATQAYKDEQDIMGEWLNDCCNKSASAVSNKGACYDTYANWARSRGQIPLAQGRFTLRLRDRGFKLDPGRRNIVGIELKGANAWAAR